MSESIGVLQLAFGELQNTEWLWSLVIGVRKLSESGFIKGQYTGRTDLKLDSLSHQTSEPFGVLQNTPAERSPFQGRQLIRTFATFSLIVFQSPSLRYCCCIERVAGGKNNPGRFPARINERVSGYLATNPSRHQE